MWRTAAQLLIASGSDQRLEVCLQSVASCKIIGQEHLVVGAQLDAAFKECFGGVSM